MHRRTLFVLPLLLSAFPAAAVPQGVSEVRVGTSPARAQRMQRRLRIPVRAVGTRLVDALDAGHLELALLSAAELDAARRRMGARLVVLRGTMDGRTPVTRRVLPPTLRQDLEAALA